MFNIKDVSVNFDGLKVLDRFSLAIEPHGITCLLGPSGCGKTTLLNAVASLVEYSGSVDPIERLSYIFQEDRLLPWYTVKENIAYVLPKEQDHTQVIDHILEVVGLKGYMDEYPNALSGGMKRRVSIARAFAYPSDILLMDEPFKGLDQKLKLQIMSEFKKLWNEDKRTVIMVTHDEREAEFLGDVSYMLKGLPLSLDYQLMHD